jgi:hypothetical protein
MSLRALLLGLALAAGFQGCASAAEPLTLSAERDLTLGNPRLQRPEDMQLTRDGKHIIVLVHLPDDRVHPLSVKMQKPAGERPRLSHPGGVQLHGSARMGTFKS